MNKNENLITNKHGIEIYKYQTSDMKEPKYFINKKQLYLGQKNYFFFGAFIFFSGVLPIFNFFIFFFINF